MLRIVGYEMSDCASLIQAYPTYETDSHKRRVILRACLSFIDPRRK
jgi:hypothetical protein